MTTFYLLSGDNLVILIGIFTYILMLGKIKKLNLHVTLPAFCRHLLGNNPFLRVSVLPKGLVELLSNFKSNTFF
jgi:hypothetical protein